MEIHAFRLTPGQGPEEVSVGIRQGREARGGMHRDVRGLAVEGARPASRSQSAQHRIAASTTRTSLRTRPCPVSSTTGRLTPSVHPIPPRQVTPPARGQVRGNETGDPDERFGDRVPDGHGVFRHGAHPQVPADYQGNVRRATRRAARCYHRRDRPRKGTHPPPTSARTRRDPTSHETRARAPGPDASLNGVKTDAAKSCSDWWGDREDRGGAERGEGACGAFSDRCRVALPADAKREHSRVDPARGIQRHRAR